MNATWLRRLRWLLAAATFLIAACAHPTGAKGTVYANTAVWQGRLALRVHSTPEQSLTAQFDLQGSPEAGSLRLSTPLGTVVAYLQWDSQAATLQASGETRQFASLQALAHHVTGTTLPISSLFAWLEGTPQDASGWQVDLSAMPDGRLSAQRLDGDTPAELKIILDR